MNKSDATDSISVKMIPIKDVEVINPRSRNKKVFQQIVDSIEAVGLKRPITVARATDKKRKKPYNLVCGQGRLEALLQLGEKEIPAVILDVGEEDSLIMSLVENLARRQHHPLELLKNIGALSERGYSDSEIARKTGLSLTYVRDINRLLRQGEERLVTAVEAGYIPISVAAEIAETDQEGAQEALSQAYQSGKLRGRKLIAARKLIEQRRRIGKRIGGIASRKSPMSSDALVRAYEKETERQKILIRKAEVTHNRLLFVIHALSTLLDDANFVNLLRAEGLATLPRPIAELVKQSKTNG